MSKNALKHKYIEKNHRKDLIGQWVWEWSGSFFSLTINFPIFKLFRLLQKCSKGGQFEYESCFRNGYYLIEIDVPVFRRLIEIDSDIDKLSLVQY